MTMIQERHEKQHQRHRRVPWERVWLLNSDFLVLGPIEWDRAIGMVVDGDATSFKVHPTFVIRSQYLVVPFPEMIISRDWVHRRYPKRGMQDSDLASRRDILRRDGYVCGYCGKFGDTIDHIHPESLGGENTWSNLITACKKCNNDKDDRSLKESGMKLLWNPKNRGLEYASIQAEVWKILDEQFNSTLVADAPWGVYVDSTVHRHD